MPGGDHGPSIKCPDIYDALIEQGYDKTKAAKISNAACKKRTKASAEAKAMDLTDEEWDDAIPLLKAIWKDLYPDEAVPDFKASEPRTAADELPASCRVGSFTICDDEGMFDGGMIRKAAKSVQEMDDGERDEMMPKLIAAYKRLYPDMDVSDMPDELMMPKKAAEDDGIVEPDEKPSRDYLAALWDALKGAVGIGITKAEFEKAHRSAMGKAGGKASARARKKKDAAEFRDHIAVHPEPVEACAFCYDYYGSTPTKLPKSDDRVAYQSSVVADTTMVDTATQACGKCRFYQWGQCQLVEGTIEAADVCDLFLPQPVTYLPSIYHAASDTGDSWRLFMDQGPVKLADAPEWINVLPVPGAYAHPSYGMIVIDEDRNQRFIDNFENRVYQQDLPITIDIEHDNRMSGAMATIDDMRMNDDGSVDARVSWTERGKSLVEGEQFRYFSPEWWDTWTDPATQNVYQDVLVGGAITVRPFFKENALRPLVASEGGLFVPSGGVINRSDAVIVMQQVPPVIGFTVDQTKEKPMATVQLSEDEVADLRAKAKQFDDAEAERVRLAEQVGRLTRESRNKRFNDIVRGEGGGGNVWIGDVAKNVAILETLADATGEESEQFAEFVATQRENAKAFAENAALTKPVGHSGDTRPNATAANEVDQRAADLMANDPKLDKAAAIRQVFKEQPALYERHRAETTRVASPSRS